MHQSSSSKRNLTALGDVLDTFKYCCFTQVVQSPMKLNWWRHQLSWRLYSGSHSQECFTAGSGLKCQCIDVLETGMFCHCITYYSQVKHCFLSLVVKWEGLHITMCLVKDLRTWAICWLIKGKQLRLLEINLRQTASIFSKQHLKLTWVLIVSHFRRDIKTPAKKYQSNSFGSSSPDGAHYRQHSGPGCGWKLPQHANA